MMYQLAKGLSPFFGEHPCKKIPLVLRTMKLIIAQLLQASGYPERNLMSILLMRIESISGHLELS